jgi:hypothetical protein
MKSPSYGKHGWQFGRFGKSISCAMFEVKEGFID